MKRLAVFDVIAEDWWEYEHDGKPYVAHVSLGRPRRGDDEWSCPLRIEGAHEVWNPFSKHKRWTGWKPIAGIGPMDALQNALLFAFRMFAEFRPKSVAAPMHELEKAVRRRARLSPKKKKRRSRGRARR